MNGMRGVQAKGGERRKGNEAPPPGLVFLKKSFYELFVFCFFLFLQGKEETPVLVEFLWWMLDQVWGLLW